MTAENFIPEKQKKRELRMWKQKSRRKKKQSQWGQYEREMKDSSHLISNI